MKIAVILASVRTNRLGERIAKWVAAEAAQYPDFEVQLLDLANYNLPFFDEPLPPRFNPGRQPHANVKRWLADLAAADGYLIVTPEYNAAIPGTLKNALDFIDHQFTKKPVAIVSYGIVGGSRAAEQLKLLLVASRAAVVPQGVAITGAETSFDATGRYLGDPEAFGPPKALAATLTELDWWAKTLAAGRSAAVAAMR